MYDEHRAECVKFRGGAISTAFDELDGIINKSALTRDYFGKSQSWFSQRVHSAHVGGVDVQFTARDAHRLADAFRDIARRLCGLANEIDAAADTE